MRSRDTMKEQKRRIWLYLAIMILTTLLVLCLGTLVGLVYIDESHTDVTLQLSKQLENKSAVILGTSKQTDNHFRQYLLEEPSKCTGHYDLIMAIKSMPSNRDRRDTIRQTWAKTDLMADYKIKRIFLLGRENSTLSVSDEATEFGDILQADFGENFHNLTYKDYFFLSWFESQSCQTKFVFKGDDDILLNTFLLKQLLNKYQDHVKEPFMMGSVLRNSPRVTDKSSKYFVSGDQYRAAYYPPYVSGGGFVMTTSLALALAKAMSKYFGDSSSIMNIPPLPIDDAFLGVCLQNAGLTSAIRNNRGFKSWGLDHSVLNGADDKICKILQLYSIHDISTEEVRQVWSEMTDLGTLVDKCQFKQIPDELLKM